MSEAAPIVSVIVPVWNGEREIGLCLDALARQTATAETFEVIVVDNGSSDATAEVVRGYPGVTLLGEPTPGSYAARNSALAVARGRLALFTDADCVPDASWVETAIALGRAGLKHGVVGGRIETFRTERGGLACALYDQLFHFDQAKNVANGKVVTANWLCETATLRRLGGFDGRLKSGGDAEMARRVRESGATLGYDDRLIVRHPARERGEELVRKRVRIIGGLWQQQQPRGAAIAPFLWFWTKASLAQIKRALAAPAPLGQRLGVVGLVVRLAGAQTREVARLALGGEPTRS